MALEKSLIQCKPNFIASAVNPGACEGFVCMSTFINLQTRLITVDTKDNRQAQRKPIILSRCLH